VQPTYPAEAKSKGTEGIVQLDILVTAAGDVKDARVIKGPSELREAATGAVRQWKYEPADTDTRMTITVRFMLAKEDKGPRGPDQP
jgi:protein TonB